MPSSPLWNNTVCAVLLRYATIQHVSSSWQWRCATIEFTLPLQYATVQQTPHCQSSWLMSKCPLRCVANCIYNMYVYVWLLTYMHNVRINITGAMNIQSLQLRAACCCKGRTVVRFYWLHSNNAHTMLSIQQRNIISTVVLEQLEIADRLETCQLMSFRSTFSIFAGSCHLNLFLNGGQNSKFLTECCYGNGNLFEECYNIILMVQMITIPDKHSTKTYLNYYGIVITIVLSMCIYIK